MGLLHEQYPAAWKGKRGAYGTWFVSGLPTGGLWGKAFLCLCAWAKEKPQSLHDWMAQTPRYTVPLAGLIDCCCCYKVFCSMKCKGSMSGLNYLLPDVCVSPAAPGLLSPHGFCFLLPVERRRERARVRACARTVIGADAAWRGGGRPGSSLPSVHQREKLYSACQFAEGCEGTRSSDAELSRIGLPMLC